jgi:putative transposase
MKNRKPNRMKGYDYSRNNLYFVTSCVKNMECCFGDIVVGTGRDLSVLHVGRDLSVPCDVSENENPFTKIVLNEFGKIMDNQLQWLENQYPYVVLHDYVVMPNHIHAIIEIVRTGRDLSVPLPQKIKSLSELMGAFKTTSSKLIHLAGYLDFQWHRSFHDHIIKDESSYLNISNYIKSNPEQWIKDKFYR